MELCEEAKKTVEDNNMCAKLRMSMNGTKAAAQNWQKKVQETMATLGLSIGKASPVLFLSSTKKFEMSRARRRLRCIRRTSRSGLDEKRVGVEAGNQYYKHLEMNQACQFENPHVQREQGGSARQNRRHCGEEKIGKVGHEGAATGRTDFEPCRNHSV